MTQCIGNCTECPEKVDIQPTLAKPGDEWSPTDKVKVACWLTRERREQYMTIGLLSLDNVEDVEDAFQDFCMKKIIGIGFPKYDPQGNADSYFLGAWRNYLTDYRRRRGRRVRKEQQAPVDEEGKPLVEAVDKDPPVPTLVDLKQRLESLPAEQRIVILQRHYDGRGRLKPYKDIAAELGKSEEAVKKVYQRGMESLRKQADDEDQRTVMIETAPPDEEPKRTGSDADTATDRWIRQTKSEDLP